MNPEGAVTIPTVLVVEDEVLIRLSIADHLSDCGYHVLDAGSAAEAQQILERGARVDLVFSDIQMPGEKDGFALAAWVREHHPHIRIVLTSGVRKMAEEAKRLCAHHELFLDKPYEYDRLSRELAALLPPKAKGT
jgi:CheY-like chemotaxis protein